jgi:hypothetical protein
MDALARVVAFRRRSTVSAPSRSRPFLMNTSTRQWCQLSVTSTDFNSSVAVNLSDVIFCNCSSMTDCNRSAYTAATCGWMSAVPALTPVPSPFTHQNRGVGRLVGITDRDGASLLPLNASGSYFTRNTWGWLSNATLPGSACPNVLRMPENNVDVNASSTLTSKPQNGRWSMWSGV